MSDDRTAPMKQPQWARRDVEPDDQETILANQDSPTPPTMPAGPPKQGGWEPPPGPGFVRTTPAEPTTPQPRQQPPAPYAAPPYPGPEAPRDQTMLISEQPSKPVFAWLVVVDGPERSTIGEIHTLHPNSSTIGRAQDNHIRIRDETCSALHARVRVEAREEGEPAYVLYDMGSSNGTYVGDREKYKDEENKKYRCELQDGDYLLLGETTLVFKRI